MADEIKTTPSTEEKNPDWFEEGYSTLQGEPEFIIEGDVTIPTSRYDELLRAEHTVELIKKAYTDKAFKYDRDRAIVVKLLLGLETEDE